MAAIADVKEIGLGFDNLPTYLRLVYDFAVDGGTVGALDLFVAKTNIIVSRTIMHVLTAGDSGTSTAEVSVGKTGAATAFVNGASTGLVTALTENKVIVSTAPSRIAAGDKAILTIGEEDLTAGKIAFLFEIHKANS